MKKLLFTIAIGSLLMASCTSTRYTATYDVDLSNVKKTEKGKPTISVGSLDTIKGVGKNCYSDSTIKVCFTPTKKDIGFTLTNLTDENLKLVWDEALITTIGSQSRVMHDGIKFIDRNSFQRPSVIYPNQTLSDIVTPTENVYWRDGVATQNSYVAGGWEQKPLILDKSYIEGYGTEVMDSTKFTDFVKSMSDGGTININLPLTTDDNKRKDYQFNFDVNNGKVYPVEVVDKKKSTTATYLISAGTFFLTLLLLL